MVNCGNPNVLNYLSLGRVIKFPIGSRVKRMLFQLTPLVYKAEQTTRSFKNVACVLSSTTLSML